MGKCLHSFADVINRTIAMDKILDRTKGDISVVANPSYAYDQPCAEYQEWNCQQPVFVEPCFHHEQIIIQYDLCVLISRLALANSLS